MGVFATIGNVFFETFLIVAAVFAGVVLAREYSSRRTVTLLLYCAALASASLSSLALFGGQILAANGHGPTALNVLKVCYALISTCGFFLLLAFSSRLGGKARAAIAIVAGVAVLFAVHRLTVVDAPLYQIIGTTYLHLDTPSFLSVFSTMWIAFGFLAVSRYLALSSAANSRSEDAAVNGLQFKAGLLGILFCLVTAFGSRTMSAAAIIPSFLLFLAFLALAVIGAVAEGNPDPSIVRDPFVVFRRNLMLKAVSLNAAGLWVLTFVVLAVISSSYVDGFTRSRLAGLQRNLHYFTNSHAGRNLALRGETERFAARADVLSSVKDGEIIDAEAVDAAARETLSGVDSARTIRLVDSEGVIKYSTNGAQDIGKNLRSSRAFVRALQGWSTVDVEKGQVLGLWSVRSVSPLSTPDGAPVFVVLDAEVDAAFNFSDFFAIADENSSSYGFVAEDGELVFSTGQVPAPEFLANMKANVLPKGVNSVEGDGVHAYVERSLTSDGSPDGFFYNSLSAAALDAEAFRVIALAAVITLFAIVLLTALLLVGMASALRPIQELRAAAAKVAIGEYDQRVSYESPDELGALATAFNRMFDTIRLRTQMLRTAVQEREDFLEHATRELRTPLNVFRWTLELMRFGDTGRFNKEQMELIEQLHQTNERLTKLVQNLQDVTLIDRQRVVLKKKPTAIEDLVDEGAGLVAVECRTKDIALHWVRPEIPLPLADVDPVYIGKVLQNLLNNAVKYTQQHGHVKVQVETATQSAEDGRSGSFVKVTVEDNGIGIPTEEASRIFNRFFRAKNITGFEIEGTGLGLYLAKRLVEMHGGDIWLESREGVGTTVSFTVPVQDSKVAAERKTNALT